MTTNTTQTDLGINPLDSYTSAQCWLRFGIAADVGASGLFEGRYLWGLIASGIVTPTPGPLPRAHRLIWRAKQDAAPIIAQDDRRKSRRLEKIRLVDPEAHAAFVADGGKTPPPPTLQEAQAEAVQLQQDAADLQQLRANTSVRARSDARVTPAAASEEKRMAELTQRATTRAERGRRAALQMPAIVDDGIRITREIQASIGKQAALHRSQSALAVK